MLKELKHNFNIANFLSFYRILIFPVLILLIAIDNKNAFKWLIALCFFTDLIDGYIARKLNITSKFGSTLDSIGDMFALFAALIGFVIFENDFVKENALIIGISFGLYMFQLILCLLKYKKLSSFHTYSAKIAFVFTGSFFMISFFFGVNLILFWIAISLAIIECLEEIIIVFLLPAPRQNIKSLFHVLRDRKK